MKRHRSLVVHVGLLVLIWFLSSGYYGGCTSVLRIAHEAVQLGSATEAQFERTEVNAAVAPGVKPEQLLAIKRLAVIFANAEAVSAPGGLAGVVADNVAIELMKLGYHVVDYRQIVKLNDGHGWPVRPNPVDTETALKFGVHAIVHGSLSVGRESYQTHPYARNTSGSVVKSVGLQITTVEILSIIRSTSPCQSRVKWFRSD